MIKNSPDMRGAARGCVCPESIQRSTSSRCVPCAAWPRNLRSRSTLCAAESTLPRVVWRAGLDLKPVDLSDPGEVGWLEALVWPEQTDRLARLRAAIRIASEQKPQLVKGDLRTDLAALAREAPKDVTLVIFHTAGAARTARNMSMRAKETGTDPQPTQRERLIYACAQYLSHEVQAFAHRQPGGRTFSKNRIRESPVRRRGQGLAHRLGPELGSDRFQSLDALRQEIAVARSPSMRASSSRSRAVASSSVRSRFMTRIWGR